MELTIQPSNERCWLLHWEDAFEKLRHTVLQDEKKSYINILHTNKHSFHEYKTSIKEENIMQNICY